MSWNNVRATVVKWGRKGDRRRVQLIRYRRYGFTRCTAIAFSYYHQNSMTPAHSFEFSLIFLLVCFDCVVWSTGQPVDDQYRKWQQILSCSAIMRITHYCYLRTRAGTSHHSQLADASSLFHLHFVLHGKIDGHAHLAQKLHVRNEMNWNERG